MSRHPFDPISLILGIAALALGIFFLAGDRTVADIGWKWLWPFPIILLGLLFVVSATRRMIPARSVEPKDDDEEEHIEAT
ncbi:MAG TPA: hypothetical protein VIC58_09825 [Actinomycetota bacterium]